MSDYEYIEEKMKDYESMASGYKKDLDAIKLKINTLMTDEEHTMTYDNPRIKSLTDAYDCLISQYRGTIEYVEALKERLEVIKRDPNCDHEIRYSLAQEAHDANNA